MVPLPYDCKNAYARNKVTHTDRDEEFILMQRRIKKQLRNEFGSNILEFGRMSCEDIGEWLLEQNENIYRVEVSEDGENGAIVEL